MKNFVVVLLASAAYLAVAVPMQEEPLQRGEYPRYMDIPDDEGNLHKVDLEAEPDYDLLDKVNRNNANQYFLFTRRNARASQTLVMNNANSITNSNFNANNPTVVIVHGWLSTRNTEPNPTIRNAFLNKADVNIISVDWSYLSRSDYTTAVRGVPGVGRAVGQFLTFLNQATGAAFSNMHLAGFSLGAHVVGNAGRELGGRVARITGLDPAGPLWNTNSNRLRPGDGVYVEAIHTDGSTSGLGIGSAIARTDFFPNGGNSQPGCSTSLCNHNRAWELFAATVTYNHLVGTQCNNMAQVTANTCRGGRLNMGNDNLRKTGSGIYRLNTARRYPY
ncbi:phospholipase A1 member A [Bombyx mori]|uniref:Lipase domain-containing protein n=1 Tax=Bombyx mori TaxID=7091 RepID=A0A8R2C7P7_BOMMO|nr:phospholipase A1 member A [Bombyx mori]